MELELKHIAPYLPYGLGMAYRTKGGAFEPKGVLQTLSFFPDATHEARVTLQGMDSEHIWMFKPILKPIGKLLNRELSYWDNMEKQFSPYPDKEYWKLKYGIHKNGISFSFTDGHFSTGVTQDFYQKLFELHFDVFMLINEGLAIAE
jgi:hypothetical protein